MIPAEAKLTLEFPEVFDEMTGTEVDNLFADRFKQRWGIWDRGGHMIMVLQWNETNSFLSKIYTEENGCLPTT
mgnify:FL=1